MTNPIAELRDLAQHIDPQFHFSLNEVPAVLAALVVKLADGDGLAKAIEEGQNAQRELHPLEVAGNEVRKAVADLIEPPREPSSGPAGDSAQVRALQDQIAQMREQLDRISSFVPTQAPAPAPAPAAPSSLGVGNAEGTPPAESSPAGAPPTPEPAPSASAPGQSERELELRAQVEQLQHALAQRAALDSAAGGHPTVTHEQGAGGEQSQASAGGAPS